MTREELIKDLETNYIQGMIDAGKYIGVSNTAILNWSKTAKLNPITIGRNMWFSRKELDEIKKKRST